jgi:hypothetical protein
MENNEVNNQQENINVPYDTSPQPAQETQQINNTSNVILQSKINIQRTVMTHITKPGVISTDGNKISIVRDDGKVLFDSPIDDIKYVKIQFSIIYIYFGFNKVYTVNFDDTAKEINLDDYVSNSETEKWADFFRQKNVKFVGFFRQIFNVLRNFLLFVIVFYIVLGVLIIIFG